MRMPKRLRDAIKSYKYAMVYSASRRTALRIALRRICK